MPVLSLIIPSRSTEDRNLQRLLASLRRQTFTDYEILIETQGNSEEAKARGALKAQGELLGFLCTDNDLRDSNFLRTMVWYARQPTVTGAYTAQYAYVKDDAPLSRYFALLGANDPLCWWLGRADRTSYHAGARTSLRVFTHDRLPSLGDNGFFVKRQLVQRLSFTPATFGSCMCLCEDLRRLGHATYWVVSEQQLWHRTGEDVWGYFVRRFHYVNTLFWKKHEIRRWRMVEGRDTLRVVTFVLASVLVLPHLSTSLRGYLRVRDPAWFLHPLVCLGLLVVYGLGCLMYWPPLLFRRWIGKRRSPTVSGA